MLMGSASGMNDSTVADVGAGGGGGGGGGSIAGVMVTDSGVMVTGSGGSSLIFSLHPSH